MLDQFAVRVQKIRSILPAMWFLLNTLPSKGLRFTEKRHHPKMNGYCRCALWVAFIDIVRDGLLYIYSQYSTVYSYYWCWWLSSFLWIVLCALKSTLLRLFPTLGLAGARLGVIIRFTLFLLCIYIYIWCVLIHKEGEVIKFNSRVLFDHWLRIPTVAFKVPLKLCLKL